MLPASVAFVGHVIAQGVPVSGARIGMGTRSAIRSSLVGSDRQGSFQIDATPEAEPPSDPSYIFASHPTFGAGAVRVPAREGLPVAGDIIDVGTISLEAHATIRGKLLLGDGSPLADFPVHAMLLDDVPADASSNEVARAMMSQGSNRSAERLDEALVFRDSLVARSDSTGAFSFAGLVPDAVYGVAIRDGGMRHIAVAARSGANAVRLTADRQLITVDLRDPSNSAIPGARLTAVAFDPRSDSRAEPVMPGLPAKAPRIVSRFQHRDSRGRPQILSPFDWQWWLSPLDEFAAPRIVRHDALRGVHRVTLPFTVRSESEFGTLALEVVDAEGTPIDAFEAKLQRVDTQGSRWTNSLVPAARRGIVDHLAVGRWKVVVVAGRKLLFNEDLGVYGTHTREISIENGLTTRLRIEGTPGGIVALQLSTTKQGAWLTPTIRTMDARKQSIDVIRSNSPHPLMPGSSQQTTAQFVTKQPLSPGVHELLIECGGFWPERCRVNVELGRLATVPLTLRAR